VFFNLKHHELPALQPEGDSTLPHSGSASPVPWPQPLASSLTSEELEEEDFTTQKETIVGRRSSISSAAQSVFSRSRTLVELIQEELVIGVKVHVVVSESSSVEADGSRDASSSASSLRNVIQLV